MCITVSRCPMRDGEGQICTLTPASEHLHIMRSKHGGRRCRAHALLPVMSHLKKREGLGNGMGGPSESHLAQHDEIKVQKGELQGTIRRYRHLPYTLNN